MLSFISNPRLSALFLFLIFFGQSLFEQDFVNRIMGDVLLKFILKNLFETSCTQFLLFVDFQYLVSDLSIYLFFLTARFLFAVEMLNFISAAISLVLLPLILFRMM